MARANVARFLVRNARLSEIEDQNGADDSRAERVESGASSTASHVNHAGFWVSVRDALSGRPHDLTTEHLSRAIVLLAVPMVLEMVMESAFAVADIWFLSRLPNPADAVAAVGLTEAVIVFVYAIALGLAMATTATVARRIGEGEPDQAVTAATQSIAIGVLVSIVVAVIGWFGAEAILTGMGAEPGTIAAGLDYTRILFATNVVIMLLFLHNAIFRGAGDAVLSMRSLWIANGLNIALDPILIFGWGPIPEMGVMGAAVATTLGRGTGVAYQMWHLRRGSGRIRLAGPACHFDLGASLRLLRVSAGGITQMLIGTASWTGLMKIVSTFGAEVVAGYTIAIRIVIFVLLPSWGLANAAATLVGQNLGAGHPERAEKATWLAGIYNTVFLGSLSVVFVLFADELVGLFTSEPALLEVGARGLTVMSYGYVFYAWGMVMIQAFNGAGDTLTPTWVNLLCFWVIQLPMAWVLAVTWGRGPDGVFWAIMGAEAIFAGVSVLLFRRGKWKTRVV